MIVIANKSSRRILKGEKYDVQSLTNSVTSRWRKIYIKDLGGFSPEAFNDIDGNTLPRIDWRENVVVSKKAEFEDLKVGDILVCTKDSYKTIFKDKKYQISELKVIEKNRKDYLGNNKAYYEKKIKFLGNNRFFDYNTWRFRPLDKEESRNITLNNLLYNESESLSVDKNIRKIDVVDDKDLELIKLLSESIIDKYRHKLSVIDWVCDKKGKSFKVTGDDFKHLLKLPFSKILEIVENSNKK